MSKYLAIFIVLTFVNTWDYAQTWTGATSTDWNTGTNWNPVGVPAPGGNITIPGSVASNRWPVLAANTTCNNFNSSPGSQINTNGFTLTLNGAFDIFGLVINNTKPATDITLNLTGPGANYFRGSTINDNITINWSSNSTLYESYNAGNTFNGNTIININTDGLAYIGYNNLSTFNGNLAINRTVAGTTIIFNFGVNGVSGNFSFTNTVGGSTSIGQNNGVYSVIGGTVNINIAPPAGAHNTALFRLKNMAAGGSVILKNNGNVILIEDTLKATVAIDSFSSAGNFDWYRNAIEGNTTISSASTNTGQIQFRQSRFNGSFAFTHVGTGVIYEGYTGGNLYNGTAQFNFNSIAQAYICYDNRSTFNSHLTITRNAIGLSNIFNNGVAGIAGNFTYTNTVGGSTSIGSNGFLSVIGGTMNVNVNAPIGNPGFAMVKMKNLTAGGTTSVQNVGNVYFENDTIIGNLTVNNHASPTTHDFVRLSVTGTTTIAERSINAAGTYLRQSVFNGPFSYTNRSAGILYEAYQGGNIYNGNAVFNIEGTGTQFICYDHRSSFNGNLTINRTEAGASNIFNIGAQLVSGNFSYTNNAGGSTVIGSNGFLTVVNGLLNVNVNSPAGNPSFSMYKMKNLTVGGNVVVQNSGLFVMDNDTLSCNLTVNGHTSNSTHDFLRLAITGNTNITERSGSTATTYLRLSRFNGTFNYTGRSGGTLFEAYQGGNIYNGNASFNFDASGAANICYDHRSTFNGNLTITRTVVGATGIFNVGSPLVAGNFSYTNNIGGGTSIGTAGFVTLVNGMVNINAKATGGNPSFAIIRLKNLMGGGSVLIENAGLLDIRDDTLVANTFEFKNFNSGGSADFLRNDFSGPVTLNEGNANGGGIYFRLNRISGVFNLFKNASSSLFEAYQGPNTYLNDANFTRNDGGLNIAYDHPTYFHKNLTLQYAASTGFNQPVVFRGDMNGVLEQKGSQLISMPRIIMEKGNGAQITLLDSVNITNNIHFISGYLYTSNSAELLIDNGATATGASDASHVVGPVSKTGQQAFDFPLGNGQFIQRLSITNPVLTTDRFRAEYFASSAHPLYDTANRAGTLVNVSGAQYWTLDRKAGSSNVVVTLDFGKPRGVAQSATSAGLRVARWNGSSWLDLGNGGTTGSATEGTVKTAAAVSTFSPFTIASAAGINPLLNTAAPLSAPACANTVINVPFQSSGGFNPGNIFTAQLSDATGNFANPVNIGSLALAPDGIAVNGSIPAYLPSSAIITGNAYRIRVVSSQPAHNGTNNGSNIVINSLYIGKDTVVALDCYNDNISLLPLYNTTGLTATWNTATPASVPAGNYRLDVVNGIGCKDTANASVILELATWTGALGNNWHLPGNWSSGKVPGEKTHVIIPNGTPNPCVVSASNAFAASVQVKTGASVTTNNGRQLTIAGKCVTLPPL